MNKYTGNDLLKLGCPQGPLVGKLLAIVNREPLDNEQVKALIKKHIPVELPLHAEAAPCQFNISANNEVEASNVAAVKATMEVVLRTPCVVEGAVMPDACPAGPIGTIPVGGVVAAENAIIPGMHSADICCSLMATVFDDISPSQVLDAAHQSTHFGPGGREPGRQIALPESLDEAISALPYEAGLNKLARLHTGTQGDGNHFLFVGTLESSGKTVMITHHGSRGFGARLYKHGKKIAERFRRTLSPDTHPANAWIPFDTDEGKAYWEALQVVRDWTRHNHECLHELTAQRSGASISDRFWNEHNFVFREQTDTGNLFWHAKGATPIHNEFMPDTNGVQIVPLNMAEPVLFIKGARNITNRGFAPHGAGRNMSRTKHKKLMAGRTDEEIFRHETEGLDVRFYSGNIDVSELPSAYKNAAAIEQDMARFSLAEIVDRVLPYGSIMAGDWQRDVSWKQLRKDKRNAKKQQTRKQRRSAKQNLFTDSSPD